MAELVAGRGRDVKSFLYFFVDTFIGGGLVLDSHLRGGLNGNAGAVAEARALRAPWLKPTRAWLADASAAIAQAVQSAACLLDVEGVILDGSFARELLAALLSQTTAALTRYDWEGVKQPALMAGTIGSDARALGGALLPLYANFAPDRDLFLKVGFEAAVLAGVLSAAQRRIAWSVGLDVPAEHIDSYQTWGPSTGVMAQLGTTEYRRMMDCTSLEFAGLMLRSLKTCKPRAAIALSNSATQNWSVLKRER